MTPTRSRTNPLPRILSVVGTDTEVGKTVLTAALARAFVARGLRVGVFKPFACDPAVRADGTPFSTDADLLARAVGLAGDRAEACGQLLRAPMSPLAAARAEGAKVRIAAVMKRIRALAVHNDVTLVEGVGGWEVPLSPRVMTSDFFADIAAPVIIVGRSGLGTLNHCLLTARAIEARGLPILALVLNQCAPPVRSKSDPTESNNADLLRELVRYPVFGPVPWRKALAKPSAADIRVRDLPDLSDITTALFGAA